MSRELPAILAGDWNLPHGEVTDLARQLGAELVPGRTVDHVLLIGAGIKLRKVRRDLPKHGSDHEPLLVDLELAGEALRLIWWNVYVGQHPHRVALAVAQLLRLDPHVVALGEAYRCRTELADLARMAGYRLLQGRRGEGADLAVLVRNDLQLAGRPRRAKLRSSWIGPVHGTVKAPREFPRLRLRTPGGQLFRLLVVHLPTGGYAGRNASAVREAVDRIRRWVQR